MAIASATLDVPTLTDRARSLLARRTTAWRVPLVAASLVTTAAHIPVTGEHLAEARYIGVLFILLEIASVVLAAVLIVRPSRAALLGTSAVGALAVLALILSRTVGLPLIGDDIGNWAEPLAVVSVVAELVMTVGGLVAGTRHTAPTDRALRVGLALGLLALLVGAIATSAATAAEYPAGSSGNDMPGMKMGLPSAPGALHVEA